MNESDHLNFADRRAYVENALGSEPRLTVYEYTERDGEKIGYFCALVPLEKVPDCLGERSWDLLIDHGLPGRMYCGDHSQYLRFGDDNGVKPLVLYFSDLFRAPNRLTKIIQNPHEIEKKNSPRAASNASR